MPHILVYSVSNFHLRLSPPPLYYILAYYTCYTIKNDLLSLGGGKAEGDKRWVLFSVLGEIPSFSRTDEEETNSTIHSLPFTKKKTYSGHHRFVCWWAKLLLLPPPGFTLYTYIHQPMSWLYTMLLRGAG